MTAEQFLQNETEFQLGFLPTEQPHPKTVGLDEICRQDLLRGIATLLSVDGDIPPKAEQVFRSGEFKALVDAFRASLAAGGRIVFSGCGATGRLSILLEASWRKACRLRKGKSSSLAEEMENRVASIMTGGDYALVRSVESFEDYAGFGRRQARDLGLGPADTYVAVTEGGETSSVLGSAMQAAGDGAAVFLAFNNPADLLCRKIARSRAAITDPRITVLDLSTGPMAIAGSTRMQAVTTELLVLGYALQQVFNSVTGGEEDDSPCVTFSRLLDDLAGGKSLEALSRFVRYEEEIYTRGGLVTYFADRVLLDIFTDTTERAPTFMLPPFVKRDDDVAPQSWAFVKNPLYPTGTAWEEALGRKPRCLEWTRRDYLDLKAADNIVAAPPAIGYSEIIKFTIGNEKDKRRFQAAPSAAIAVVLSASDREQGAGELGAAFNRQKKDFTESRAVFIGEDPESPGAWHLPVRIKKSALNLWEHLAVKLVMNTISTVTMVRMGRVESNWMSWVETSNKKLVDRGTRLVAEICGLSYQSACRELFASLEEMANTGWEGRERLSPVQYTIKRLRVGS